MKELLDKKTIEKIVSILEEGFLKAKDTKKDEIKKAAKEAAKILEYPRLWHWFLYLLCTDKDDKKTELIKIAKMIISLRELEKQKVKLKLDSEGVWGWDVQHALDIWDAVKGNSKLFQKFAEVEMKRYDRFDAFEKASKLSVRVDDLPLYMVKPHNVIKLYIFLETSYGRLKRLLKGNPIIINEILELSYPRLMLFAKEYLSKRSIRICKTISKIKNMDYGDIMSDKKLEYYINPVARWRWYAKKLGVKIPKGIPYYCFEKYPFPQGLKKETLKFIFEIITSMRGNSPVIYDYAAFASYYPENDIIKFLNIVKLYQNDIKRIKTILEKINSQNGTVYLGHQWLTDKIISKWDNKTKEAFKEHVDRDVRFLEIVDKFQKLYKRKGSNIKNYEEALKLLKEE